MAEPVEAHIRSEQLHKERGKNSLPGTGAALYKNPIGLTLRQPFQDFQYRAMLVFGEGFKRRIFEYL
ncbi:MAG: hypothetical protein ABS46_01015 [Cytophagaceae bacterium SCN 52-12]|nr:MAG: hypothetical protein ABS46_01015 [Cytophagaceae bacterium SCN 52-12]